MDVIYIHMGQNVDNISMKNLFPSTTITASVLVIEQR